MALAGYEADAERGISEEEEEINLATLAFASKKARSRAGRGQSDNVLAASAAVAELPVKKRRRLCESDSQSDSDSTCSSDATRTRTCNGLQANSAAANAKASDQDSSDSDENDEAGLTIYQHRCKYQYFTGKTSCRHHGQYPRRHRYFHTDPPPVCRATARPIPREAVLLRGGLITGTASSLNDTGSSSNNEVRLLKTWATRTVHGNDSTALEPQQLQLQPSSLSSSLCTNSSTSNNLSSDLSALSAMLLCMPTPLPLLQQRLASLLNSNSSQAQAQHSDNNDASPCTIEQALAFSNHPRVLLEAVSPTGHRVVHHNAAYEAFRHINTANTTSCTSVAATTDKDRDYHRGLPGSSTHKIETTRSRDINTKTIMAGMEDAEYKTIHAAAQDLFPGQPLVIVRPVQAFMATTNGPPRLFGNPNVVGVTHYLLELAAIPPASSSMAVSSSFTPAPAGNNDAEYKATISSSDNNAADNKPMATSPVFGLGQPARAIG